MRAMHTPHRERLAEQHRAHVNIERAREIQAPALTPETALRQRFLLESSRILGESLEYETTLRAVARLAVPSVADWCVVDLLQRDGAIARVAIAHRDPARRELAELLQQHYPPMMHVPLGPGHVLRTGRTESQARVPKSFVRAAAAEPERLTLLQALGLHSYVCAPLRARGRLLGSITLFTERGRSLGRADVTMVEELAQRAATAIDNAILYDHAQRALQSRDEVLARVSHDLRTPLSAIMMGAAVQIATAPSTPEGRRTRQRAEVFQRSARHMCRLISDLTDFAHVETGRLALERQLHRPESLLREVVETLRPTASNEGARLELDTSGDLGLVDCDRDRIVQALSNLVSNAIKVGSPVITLRASIKDEDVMFAVQDTGPGIGEADLPHVFDRYWRGTAIYRGTGLGLPIVKGIIDAHGGQCSVSSQVGVGTTVFFSLPRQQLPAS
jgi:signal transduction histidine kinase